MTPTQKKDKQPEKGKEKVVDLEVEEGQGTEDVDAKGEEPITKLPHYIPPRKGKEKIPKDPNSEKFATFRPLLPKQVPFEGPRLVRVLLLKMEDWDLADHTNFPHLSMDNFMKQVYY